MGGFPHSIEDWIRRVERGEGQWQGEELVFGHPGTSFSLCPLQVESNTFMFLSKRLKQEKKPIKFNFVIDLGAQHQCSVACQWHTVRTNESACAGPSKLILESAAMYWQTLAYCSFCNPVTRLAACIWVTFWFIQRGTTTLQTCHQQLTVIQTTAPDVIQMHCWLGLRPGSLWGSSLRYPDPLAGFWGGERVTFFH